MFVTQGCCPTGTHSQSRTWRSIRRRTTLCVCVLLLAARAVMVLAERTSDAAALDSVKGSDAASTVPRFHRKGTVALMARMLDFERGRLRFEAGLRQGKKKQGRHMNDEARLCNQDERVDNNPPTLSPGRAAARLDHATVADTTNDIECFVDDVTGTVLNLVQGKMSTCKSGGTRTVIPTTGKRVTRIDMAVDKQLPLVGRLVFAVQGDDGAVVEHTCGWAGGQAVALVPTGHTVGEVQVGCQPLTPLDPTRHHVLPTNIQVINPELVRVVAGKQATGFSITPTGVVMSPSFAVPMGMLSEAALNALATMASRPNPLAKKKQKHAG